MTSSAIRQMPACIFRISLSGLSSMQKTMQDLNVAGVLKQGYCPIPFQDFALEVLAKASGWEVFCQRFGGLRGLEFISMMRGQFREVFHGIDFSS